MLTELAVGVERDFATLLDDLLEQAGDTQAAQGAAPSLRFDMLEQIERLRAENPALSTPDAMEGYDAFAMGPAPTEARDEPLPPMDRDGVAKELAITVRTTRVDLDRLRREFARANHPDRVSAHLRQRAMVRMQLANMLIDEARDRLPAPAR